MKKRAPGLLRASLSLLLLAGTAMAADVHWLGANTTSGLITDVDVNSDALWSDAEVPDGSDTAWFDWTQTDPAQWTNIVIEGAFDPGSMVIKADADAELRFRSAASTAQGP